MYIDSSHELYSDYSSIVIVDKGIDSVDLKIVKEMNSGDIVVTQDYGLASLVLAKGGLCVHQNGFIYTENNIERLLFERFIGSENRKKGIRTKNMSKRKASTDSLFEDVFTALIKENVWI